MPCVRPQKSARTAFAGEQFPRPETKKARRFSTSLEKPEPTGIEASELPSPWERLAVREF
jgi:hypothetical protein